MAYTYQTYSQLLDSSGAVLKDIGLSPIVIYNNTTTFNAGGDTGALYIPLIQAVFFSINITALAGATPGVQLFYDQQDAAGNWMFSLQSTTKLVATGSSYGSIGKTGLGQCLSGICRLRWAFDAGTTNFTGTVSAIGRQ